MGVANAIDPFHVDLLVGWCFLVFHAGKPPSTFTTFRVNICVTFCPSIDMQQIQGRDTTIQGSYNTPWYRTPVRQSPGNANYWKEFPKNCPGWYRLPFRGVFQFGVLFHNLGVTIGETSKVRFGGNDSHQLMDALICVFFQKEYPLENKTKTQERFLLWVVNWTHKKVSKRS